MGGPKGRSRWGALALGLVLVGGRPGLPVAGGEIEEVVVPPGGRRLLVVSCLARSPGPFPIRIDVTEAGRCRVRETLLDPDRAEPRRDPPETRSREGPPATATPPVARDFHLLARGGDPASPSNYVTVTADLAAVGRRVQVYVDRPDRPRVREETVADLVRTFDEAVYPRVSALLGPADDVDGDGRFTLLLTSWLGRLSGGTVAVDGFVRGADLDEGLAAPLSNHGDLMYLNADRPAGPHLRSVVAHEYAHAAVASRKRGRPDRAGEDAWLDEAIAHLVEDRLGFSRSNLDYRVSAFLSDPGRYRLLVEDYHAADLFRGHGERGSTYLFVRWCTEAHGPGLLAALGRSELKGIANLEAATGRSFEALFREWSAALALGAVVGSGRDEADGWVLVGPRVDRIGAGEPGRTWSIAGTATRAAVIEAGDSGSARVRVSAPPEAGLQVSTIRLPDDLARVDLEVDLTSGPEGTMSARLRCREQSGRPVSLECLAWERRVPLPDPHVPGFRRGRIGVADLVRVLGTSGLAAGERRASGPIPLEGVGPGDGPLVFKLVGRDAKGRRVTAWADAETDAPIAP